MHFKQSVQIFGSNTLLCIVQYIQMNCSTIVTHERNLRLSNPWLSFPLFFDLPLKIKIKKLFNHITNNVALSKWVRIIKFVVYSGCLWILAYIECPISRISEAFKTKIEVLNLLINSSIGWSNHAQGGSSLRFLVRLNKMNDKKNYLRYLKMMIRIISSTITTNPAPAPT